MKDIVTFETAVRLRDAGFPQPTPEAGQFWYYIRFPRGMARNVLCVLVHECQYQDNVEAIPLDSGERSDYEPIVRIYNPRNTQVFAPTATDILRELPGCILAIENLYKEMEIVGVYYDVWKNGRLLADHGNPAEAAAEAWIKLNDKK